MPYEQISDTELLADGTEQALVDEQVVGQYWGFVDLNVIQLGDTVILRQYVYTNGTPSLYRDKTYQKTRDDLQIGFRPKPVMTGIKITIQQTTGPYRHYHYSFNRETGPNMFTAV
jgi:hypothetical protein